MLSSVTVYDKHKLLNCCNRERTSEVEREIERQRMLELERAKTRELQHNLDMEREKQTQVRLKFARV